MPRERSFGPGPLLAKYLSLSGVPQGGVRGQTRLDGSRPFGEDGHVSLFLVPTAAEDAVPPRWCRIPSSPCPVSLLCFPSLPLLLLLSWVIHLGGRAWTQAWLAEFSLPRRCGRRADAAVEGHRRPAGRECWPRSSLPPSCRLPAARGGLLLGSRFDTHPGGVFARASASLVKAVCTCTI